MSARDINEIIGIIFPFFLTPTNISLPDRKIMSHLYFFMLCAIILSLFFHAIHIFSADGLQKKQSSTWAVKMCRLYVTRNVYEEDPNGGKGKKKCNKYFYMLLAQIKVYAQSDPFKHFAHFYAQNESKEWEFIDKMFNIHSTLSFAIHHHRINIFFCIQSRRGNMCGNWWVTY